MCVFDYFIMQLLCSRWTCTINRVGQWGSIANGFHKQSECWEQTIITYCKKNLLAFATATFAYVSVVSLLHYVNVVICPIAIAYSTEQIIKSVCVCQCVSVSVCKHSHGCISWSIFTKLGTDKRKNEFVRGHYRTTPSSVLSPKNPILGPKVLKTHANIK